MQSSNRFTLLTMGLLVAALFAVSHVPAQSTNLLVLSTETDASRILSSLPATDLPFLVCRDTDGTAGCTTGDAYYIHFGVSGDTTLTANDLKVAGTPGATTGTWLSSSTTETGLPYTSIGQVGTATAPIRCLETDGLNGWTLGDMLYFDVGTQFSNTVNDGILNRGDLRLVTISSPFSVTAGTVVTQLTDADVSASSDASRLPVNANYGCVNGEGVATFPILYFDATRNGGVDSSDTVLTSPANTATSDTSGGVSQLVPELGDILLSPSTIGGGNFGTPLTTLPTGVKLPMRVLTGTNIEPQLAIQPNSGSETLVQNRLSIHFPDPDGVDDDLLMNDVAVSGASRTAGSKITTTSTGQGNEIGCSGISACTLATVPVSSLFYYVENDGVSGFTPTDPVYLNRPASMGGGADSGCSPCVSAGDVRVTSSAVGSYSAGTVVAVGDTDLGAFGSTTGQTGFQIKAYDLDHQNAIPLQSMTSVQVGRRLVGFVAPAEDPFPSSCLGTGPFPTSGACSFLDRKNDNVYSCSSTVVVSGCIRLFVGSNNAATPVAGTTVVCPTDNDCPSGSNDVGTLFADSRIRTTGSDTTHEASKSEWIIFSNDAFVGPGDRRVSGTPATSGVVGTLIALNHVETRGSTLAGSSDQLHIARDASWPFAQIGDITMSTWGTRLTESSTDVARRLTTLTNAGLARFNRGDQSSIIDDSFYLTLSTIAPTTVQTNDLRLNAGPAGSAGSFVGSGDGTELGANAKTFLGTTINTRIMWVEADQINGASAGDWIYVDVGGSSLAGGTSGAIDIGEVRLNRVVVGSSTLDGGKTVTGSDADKAANQPVLTVSGAAAFIVYFFDANRNSVPDATDSIYLHYAPTGTPDIALPHVNDVRLSGTGGSSSVVNPPAGPVAPVGPPAAPPVAPPTSSSVPATPSDSVSPSPSGSASDEPAPTTSKKGGTPGFEMVLALAAIAGVGWAYGRRRSQ